MDLFRRNRVGVDTASHGNNLGFTTLASFNAAAGALPESLLTFDTGDTKGDLFGTTAVGGTDGVGTVFELSAPTSGTSGYTNSTLFSFSDSSATGDGSDNGVISDSNGNLWGAASQGATAATEFGVIYELTKSSGFATETTYDFSSTIGEYPFTSLVFDKFGDLFGVALEGGTSADQFGVVFELAKGDTAITDVAKFNYTDGALPKAACS